MEDVTYSRAEWALIARELYDLESDNAPSSASRRIAVLLTEVPPYWETEPCTLTLDLRVASLIHAIVRGDQESADVPSQVWALAQQSLMNEANTVICDHQTPKINSSTYRIEHRTTTSVDVLGYSSSADARQAELSAYASQLMRDGLTGELVLVDEKTGLDVARRNLFAPNPPEESSNGQEP